jgi:hypothetical protein
MKKLLIALLTAAGLAVGVRAEGTYTRYNSGFYKTYKSSDAVSSATGQTVYAGSAVLHKVIVSSAAYSVGVSTNAVFQVLDGNGSSAALRAEVNLTTQTLSSGVTEYTFDIAMSSGIYTKYSGNVTTGNVNLIYDKINAASPQGYRVWSSTYIPADTSVHNIAAGPVLLHKIIVLTKGTGTAILTAYDSRRPSSLSALERIAAIDLTDAAREYTYDILCSSGITLQSSGAGTVQPNFLVLYKKNPSQDYEVWKSSFTTGTTTLLPIVGGKDYILGGVINGDSVSSSTMTIYDSYGTATNRIAGVDGAASFDRKMYDVKISSGITLSSTGNGLYTILYKRRNN